jgi:hypothetical protein
VRWELLFADLEAQADAADRAGFEGDVVERVRAEHAALTLVARLRAHVGTTLAVRLADGDRVVARLRDVGADWALLDDGAPLLVPLAAICGVEGLSRRAVAEPADDEACAPVRRMRLTAVLRGLARDRGPVRVGLIGGDVLTGTVDRVGADHLDVALHSGDGPRRAAVVRGVCVVALAGLVSVRSVPV